MQAKVTKAYSGVAIDQAVDGHTDETNAYTLIEDDARTGPTIGLLYRESIL